MKLSIGQLFISFGISIGILSLSSPFWRAHATSFVMMTPEQKMQKADEICPLKITGVRYEKRSAGVVTLAVAKAVEPCYVKKTTGELTLIWPGGEYEENGYKYRTMVPSTPQLRKGDTVVAFLEGNGAEPYRILSWTEGLAPIFFDSKTKQYRMDALSAGRFMPSATSTPQLVTKENQLATTSKTSPGVSLQEFKKRIETVRGKRE